MNARANTNGDRIASSRQPSVDRSSRLSLAAPQTSSRRQEALIQAGLVLASELSLPAVLQKIVELACVVADARYGALGVLGQDGRLRDFITSGITERERRAIGNLPVSEGIFGVLITQAHPLRLQRIQDDPRLAGFPPHHPPMTSFLGVPISVRGNLYGSLYLTEKRGTPAFTAEDERAVVTLAAQAGVAIENARLFAEAQQRLAMEAQYRHARELHDSISQALFSMNLETRAAQLALEQKEIDADNPHQRPIRVFVVDDHAVVRRGLRAYLEIVTDIEVIGEATEGRQALDRIAGLVAAGQPADVVLMDLLMPGMDGVAATAAIIQRYREMQVVAMTSFTQADKVHGALQAGAAGYLLKDAEADEVAAAIRAARRGEAHLDPAIAKQLTRSLVAPKRGDIGCADRSGTRDPGAGCQGPLQPADRRCVGDQRTHRPNPRKQHPQEAGRSLEDAGRPAGDP